MIGLERWPEPRRTFPTPPPSFSGAATPSASCTAPGRAGAKPGWCNLFSDRFALPTHGLQAGVVSLVAKFRPDALYVHKLANPRVLEALLATDTPLVRISFARYITGLEDLFARVVGETREPLVA